jgi:beta-lactamase regulating signal transducer with metallopeptidase domain
MMLDILVNAAVRMLLVGAAAWLTLRILRVRNPHVEGLVWRMLLLAGLALPALLYLRLAPSFATSFELPTIVAAGAGGADAPPAASTSWSTARVLGAIYLGMALLLLVRLAAGLAAMWRISRAARAMAAPDDVRIAERVHSPATFGTIILLPADAHAWPANRLDAVLAHERAHVRWRDGYWSWLAQFHAAIFWFNPLAWWLKRRLETLAETTSDDAVVAARHDPIAYAALLLDFARHPNSRSVAMSVAESNVPKRIERLLARIPPAAALTRAARWTAFAALIPAAVLAASTTQAAPPTEAALPTEAAAATATPVWKAPVSLTPAAVRITRASNPDSFYPAVAKNENVSGYAIVEADLDKLGQLVDARVVKVEPAEPRFGFADAALQVARTGTFSNSTQQVASLRFMVKFDLKK